jgi:YtkA-like
MAALHATACHKPRASVPAIAIEHQIAPWPARVGPTAITLKMSNPAGKPVAGAIVKLEGDMSHPGMRPEFGEAPETEAGQYHGALTFSMAGDWVILMHITLPDGRKLERQMEVNGVAASR